MHTSTLDYPWVEGVQRRTCVLPETVRVLPSCSGGGDVGQTSFHGGVGHLGGTCKEKERKEEMEGLWEEGESKRFQGECLVQNHIAKRSTIAQGCNFSSESPDEFQLPLICKR